MQRTDALGEARRMLEMCNACRYCEAFCAVFPALEHHRTIEEPTVEYLGHLCHDCRDCYYACPYIPPHPFALNLPAALARVRHDSYASFARPRVLGRLLKAGAIPPALMSAVAIVLPLVIYLFAGFSATQPPAASLREGFYGVVSREVMILPGALLFLFAVSALGASAAAFWRHIRPAERGGAASLANALVDAATLRFQSGSGVGCSYPGPRFSQVRRRCHHGILYGFGCCFLATCAAAFCEHELGLLPPYPLLSVPVLLGTAGGLLLAAGSFGALALKLRGDPSPAHEVPLAIDYLLLVQLLLASVTGLILLAARESAHMPWLLLLHLGTILALFLSFASGKFVHWVYRFLALLRFRSESPHQPL